MGEEEVRAGRITRIDPVSIESEQHMGLGMVLGGIAGGVLGHQFGGGTGQTVATVAGTLGGVVAGHAVQKKYEQPRPGEHIIVTLTNGVAVGITQPADPGLHVGDNVRIDGSGSAARVVRR
jgi:outer membrane lipoprotein SlyB